MRIKSGLESRKCLSCFGEQSKIEFIISPLYNLCMNTLSASFSSVIISVENVFFGKMLLLRTALLGSVPRFFMHNLQGSDSNLFWASIVTGNSHQLSFSFDRRLSASLS
jgi:hypothetical protein